MRVPNAKVNSYVRDGRIYVDIVDLEIWLRRCADSLVAQGAPEIVGACVRAIADGASSTTCEGS